MRAWAAYYRHACGVAVPEEQILVTVGGSEAIVFAMMAVADPGDEILVFDPSYTNYCGFAPLAGVTPARRDAAAGATATRCLRLAQIAARSRRARALSCSATPTTRPVPSTASDDLRMLLDVAEQQRHLPDRR